MYTSYDNKLHIYKRTINIHSIGDWVTITGWPKITYQGICEINITKIEPIQLNEYTKIAYHGLSVIMEHEDNISKYGSAKNTQQKIHNKNIIKNKIKNNQTNTNTDINEKIKESNNDNSSQTGIKSVTPQ